MIDLTTEFGKRVDQRLTVEAVIWFTTVTPAGVAQPNPVWFYWDGEFIIVYSQPSSYRIHNIKNNPKVTLNLEGADALGNNVVVIQGEAAVDPNYDQVQPGYIDKYMKYLPELKMTFTQLAAEYSTEIRIRPTSLRGW